MPYSIKKISGKGWCLIRADGSTKQCHDNKTTAERARKAILIHEAGQSERTVYEKTSGESASTIHALKQEGKFRKKERSKH